MRRRTSKFGNNMGLRNIESYGGGYHYKLLAKDYVSLKVVRMVNCFMCFAYS